MEEIQGSNFNVGNGAHSGYATPTRGENGQQRLPAGFKFTKPKNYSGKRDAVELDNWIYSVREYISGYGLTGAMAVTVTASFLEGLALQYWRNIRTQFPVSGMEDILAIIRNRFYPTEYVRDIRDKLNSLKQIRSARDYVNHFQSLLFQLPVQSYSDQDMLDLFVRKLKHQTRLFVQLSNPSTLMEAMQAAERCDPIIFQARFKEDSNDMDIDAIEFKRPSGKAYKGQSYANGKRYDMECYNCHEKGHMARNCSRPESDETKQFRRERKGKSTEQGGSGLSAGFARQ
jgi:hypothetical protein